MLYNKLNHSILFVTNFFPDGTFGGIERVTDILAAHFHLVGIKCYCIYLCDSKAFQEKEYISCKYMNMKYDLSFIKEFIIENGIDIVINQSNPYYTPFLRTVCNVTNTKLITCLHNSTECKAQGYIDAITSSNILKGIIVSLFYPLYAKYSSLKLKKIHRLSLTQSDKTILLSKSLIDPYLKVLDACCLSNKIDYINNPLSFGELKDFSFIEKKQKTVLVVSRLYESQKKLSLLFKAWKLVEKANKDWNLIIVGDGPDQRKYEQITRKLNLERVLFAGRQDSYKYFQDASIFCMTSIWEGFPMTLLEAMQMGVVPIVMNSFPAVHDILEDGSDSIIVKYGDVTGMAEKIIELMNDEKRLKAMQHCAIRSSARYKADNIIEHWVELFKLLD